MRERTLSVSQFNEYVKGVFEDELVLHNLNIEGEIYEFKQTNNTTFITLRENDNLLNCVCFSLTEKFEPGFRVSVFGSVKFYGRNGRISFVFTSVRKIGTGNILAEFNELKNKLEREGLFERKKPIVSPIRDIAVITSETGAVIHDFITTVHRKRKFTNIHLFPTSVQGKLAVSEIVNGIKEAAQMNFELIVIARGGGSGDDLSTFNDENIVRAVAECPKPIISAVGHETDFTLCDFAASVRAGTPSMAGEYISRRNEEFFDRFNIAVDALKKNIVSLFGRKSNILYRTSATLSYKSEMKLEKVRSQVSDKARAISDSVKINAESKYSFLKRSAEKTIRNTEEKFSENYLRFERLSARLNANNPLRILSMGYAKLYQPNGKAVNFSETKVGDEISAITNDGKFKALITDKQKRGG